MLPCIQSTCKSIKTYLNNLNFGGNILYAIYSRWTKTSPNDFWFKTLACILSANGIKSSWHSLDIITRLEIYRAFHGGVFSAPNYSVQMWQINHRKHNKDYKITYDFTGFSAQFMATQRHPRDLPSKPLLQFRSLTSTTLQL